MYIFDHPSQGSGSIESRDVSCMNGREDPALGPKMNLFWSQSCQDTSSSDSQALSSSFSRGHVFCASVLRCTLIDSSSVI